jgi:uncharacterized membrane protein YeiH
LLQFALALTTNTASVEVEYHRLDRVLTILDYSGTYVFGVEGALAAVEGRLDVFGALVLAFCTALGGGIIRDLLIGAIPPRSISDGRYAGLAFAGGATALLLGGMMARVPPMLLVTLDAAGLTLFAIAGARKALSHNIGPLLAALLGTVTGVGGGTIRDVLLARIPTVLRADVYATAALAGSLVFVFLSRLRLPSPWASVAGALVCFGLRMLATTHGWNLPTLGSR